MNNSNQEKPSPNKSEILRVCIQLYSYQDRRINETELSVGELYHEIFGNDGGLDFNNLKSDTGMITPIQIYPMAPVLSNGEKFVWNNI